MKITCKNLEFSFSAIPLFRNLNLVINSGEHVWVRGRSGTGKSSLLRLIAGLLKPASGQILIDRFAISELPISEQQKFRLDQVGYVHQENHLIDHWTVEQNLKLVEKNKLFFTEALNHVGLDSNIALKLGSKLSGGEKQKISLARVLLQKPRLVLLDEPTSHLDDQSTEAVIQSLKNQFTNSTMIIVSHDARLATLGLRELDFGEIVL